MNFLLCCRSILSLSLWSFFFFARIASEQPRRFSCMSCEWETWCCSYSNSGASDSQILHFNTKLWPDSSWYDSSWDKIFYWIPQLVLNETLGWEIVFRPLTFIYLSWQRRRINVREKKKVLQLHRLHSWGQIDENSQHPRFLCELVCS